MPASNNHLHLLVLLFLMAFSFSCKKTKIEETVYDNVVYRVDTVPLYFSNSEKNKQKSTIQYISILYADLFGKGISNKELAELSELNLSIGDKTMANELLLSHYLNDSEVKLPTATAMRADVGQFVEEVYLRFYLRNPTAYEKYHLVNLIEEDEQLTPAKVFTAFALSNEYYFY
jgi:hypothetical protein